MEATPPPLPSRRPVKEILAADPVPADRKEGMTAKGIADLLAPLAGMSSGLLLISMKAGEALGGSFNLKTAKKTEHFFHYGYEPVVRAMALALGSLKNEITAVFDTPQGAVFEARMNVDFFSMGGEMLFEIREISPVDVKVLAQSKIKGQMFDWGKSTRAIKQVMDKTSQFLKLLAP